MQFMINDENWGEKLYKVTDDLQHNLLHMAAKKGLPMYVYYNITIIAFQCMKTVHSDCVVLRKNSSTTEKQREC